MIHKESEIKFKKFKKATIAAIAISFIGLLLSLVRIFKIHQILELFPTSIEHFFDEKNGSLFGINIIYFFTNFLLLIGCVLLLNKKIIALKFFQFSMGGLLIILVDKVFINKGVAFVDVLELIIVFLFYSFLFYHFLHLRKNGWFSPFLKKKSTAILKVQEGCNNSCTHCTVPLRHGPSRSNTLESIVAYAKVLAENGIKEVVIFGDNVGDFGTGEFGDLEHEHTFLDLLEALDKVGEIDRFRFQSILTPLFSKKTLTFFKDSLRFTPHFEIRMQSGSNEMLEKINSPYKREPYKELFENIKEIMPDAFISVDIMVGFPGETEELFLETVNYLSDLDISYVDVKSYIDKPGTSAYEIKTGKVSRAVRSERKKILVKLSKKKRQAFYTKQLGTTRTVLFGDKNKNGFIKGYTENNIKVKTYWDPELCNTLHKVNLREIDKDQFMLFDFENDKITGNHRLRI